MLTNTINNHRYKQLDSLRGVAALTVFFGHFSGIKAGIIPSGAFTSIFGFLFNGNSAVIFFFVLSGFVLSLPFTDGEKPLKLTAFYLKRIFRIYPAFIIAILISLALKGFLFDKNAMAVFSDWIKSFWAWDWNKENIKQTLRTFLLIGPDFNTHLIDPPIWSLIIEMKMSIILPFFIIIVSRNSPTLNIALLVVITYLTYKYNNYAISIFYTGILMAKYKDWLLAKINLWRTAALFTAVIIAIGLYNNNFEFLTQYHKLKPPYNYVEADYLTAIGSGLIMLIVMARKKITQFFEHKIFTFIGSISYSFYLMHLPLLLTMCSFFSAAGPFKLVYIFLSTLLSAIAISYLMFIFIEKPFQKMAAKLSAKFKILNALSV